MKAKHTFIISVEDAAGNLVHLSAIDSTRPEADVKGLVTRLGKIVEQDNVDHSYENFKPHTVVNGEWLVRS